MLDFLNFDLNNNKMAWFWSLNRRKIGDNQSWRLLWVVWICLLAQLFAKPALANPKPKAAVFGSVPIIDEKGKCFNLWFCLFIRHQKTIWVFE